MVVTILSHHDCAGSARRLAESVAVLGVDIESIGMRRGKTNKKFGIPDSKTIKGTGIEWVRSRIERSDIIHIKGDYLYNEYWHGFDISGKKRVQTFTGSRFRRGREQVVSLAKHPIKDYKADIFTAFTPELCYTKDIRLLEFAYPDFEYKWRRQEKFHIVHVPSNKKTKGTEVILEALSLLNRDDVKITLVTGVNYQEMLRLKAEASIYIDQMILPVYGNAAVEAMAQGIPTMNWDENCYPYATPVIKPFDRSPQMIALEIEKWLNWDRLEKLSRETFEYAREVHGGIGQRLLKIYQELCE